ncbi:MULTISPECIES: DUF4307 domain-containing protein [Thermomonospora]|uniref:DUF4307 domain-containing protein n=1 Tax=Thermomonospora cellulosilytica TaxID=1411118 RepID=A0A7W3MXB1_9ACTN|nr:MULTISPECIES: DUF4307 domain-containing protein [Thermomonospora]MBA9003618.1 hypothetical protein [Thermomonospora cellulosilytica]
MSTSASQPTADRRRGGRLGYAVIGVVVAICAVGWSVIMANAGRTPGIEQQTISYRVLGDSSVEVRWQVAKPSDRAVRCVVDAVDTDFAVVAQREVVVPAGRAALTRTDLLETTRRATAARVRECRTM